MTLKKTNTDNSVIATAPKNYEAALLELEGIVADMEGGELALQTAFNAYQRGFHLLQYCQGQLKSLEEQVRVFEAGQLNSFDSNNDNKN